jgi:hypothetical protein
VALLAGMKSLQAIAQLARQGCLIVKLWNDQRQSLTIKRPWPLAVPCRS